MEVNLSPLSRCLRLLVGIIPVAWAIAGGPIWSLAGFYFLFTGSWGYCPLQIAVFTMFKKDTEIKKAVL